AGGRKEFRSYVDTGPARWRKQSVGPSTATARRASHSAMSIHNPTTIDDFIALRRHLHASPELGLHEVATSRLVADLLGLWGYEVTRGIAGTGLVGTLRRGAGERSIGIR